MLIEGLDGKVVVLIHVQGPNRKRVLAVNQPGRIELVGSDSPTERCTPGTQAWHARRRRRFRLILLPGTNRQLNFASIENTSISIYIYAQCPKFSACNLMRELSRKHGLC